MMSSPLIYRMQNSRKSSSASETGSLCGQFRARPMPDFSKIKGVPPKRTHPLTDPESPAIKRSRLESPKSDKKNSSYRAAPVPDFSKVFKVKYPDRPFLMPCPFSFEEREKNKSVQKQVEQNVFTFSARPMPDFSSKTGLPPRAEASLVQPEPFNLHTEARGERHAARFQQEIEMKRQQEKLQREFKAKKDVSSILYGKPFVPHKSNRPALRTSNFVLHSELRSQERSKYDAQKFHRNCLQEAANTERKALREAEEAREIAEYRKSLVHKPQPIGSPVLLVQTNGAVNSPNTSFMADRPSNYGFSFS